MNKVYDFYITPEEYLIAAKNGISKATLESRIRKYGWNKDKALNEPVKKTIDRKKWYAVAAKNGISKQLFLSRVNKDKWDPERAATEKVTTTAERNRKYSDKVYKELEKNGISKQLFYDRVHKGWSIERAMTEKKYTQEDKTKILLSNSKKSNGFRKVHEVDWIVRSKKSANY